MDSMIYAFHIRNNSIDYSSTSYHSTRKRATARWLIPRRLRLPSGMICTYICMYIICRGQTEFEAPYSQVSQHKYVQDDPYTLPYDRLQNPHYNMILRLQAGDAGAIQQHEAPGFLCRNSLELINSCYSVDAHLL